MHSFFRTLAFLAHIATVGLHFYGVQLGPDTIDCPAQYRYISYSHGGKLKQICFTARHRSTELPPYFRDNLNCVSYQALVNLSLLHEQKKGTCETGLDHPARTWALSPLISQETYFRVNHTCVAYHQALVYLSLLHEEKKAVCQAGLPLTAGTDVGHALVSQDRYFGGNLTCVAYQALVHLSLLYEEKKGVSQAGSELTAGRRVGNASISQEYIPSTRGAEYTTKQDRDLTSLLGLPCRWLKWSFLSFLYYCFYIVREFSKQDDVFQRFTLSRIDTLQLKSQEEEEDLSKGVLLFLIFGWVTCALYMFRNQCFCIVRGFLRATDVRKLSSPPTKFDSLHSDEEGQEVPTLDQVPEDCNVGDAEVNDTPRLTKLGKISEHEVRRLNQGVTALGDSARETVVKQDHNLAFPASGASGSQHDGEQNPDITTNSTSTARTECSITVIAARKESIRASVALKKKRALAIHSEPIIQSKATSEMDTEPQSALGSNVEGIVAPDGKRTMETTEGNSSVQGVSHSAPSQDIGVRDVPAPVPTNTQHEVIMASGTEAQVSEKESSLVSVNVSTNCPLSELGLSGNESNLVSRKVVTNCPLSELEEPKVADKPEKVHVRPVAERYQVVKKERNQSESDNSTAIERTPEEFHEDLKEELEAYITKQNLRKFYPLQADNELSLHTLAAKATEKYRDELEKNKSDLDLDMATGTKTQTANTSTGTQKATNSARDDEQAVAKPSRYFSDMSKTALYTTVFLIDDSGSMRDEGRIPRLKQALERIAELTATLHRKHPHEWEGLSLRFLNYPRTKKHKDKVIVGLDAVKTKERMKGILENALRAKGGTELGRMLLQKVLQPLVYDKIETEQLQKPVLVSIITDGEPDSAASGESLKEVILDCKQRLRRWDYGENAVVFHVTQIGNNGAASTFLDGLANDPDIGGFIYCTSEHIDDQVARYERNGKLRSGYNIWWLNELIVAING